MTDTEVLKPHCQQSEHSPLLPQFLDELKAAGEQPVLDLACGSGRNGLYLDKHGLSVVFADRNDDTLSQLKPAIGNQSRIWPVDFEVPKMHPLANQQFSSILVFRYLHRPLFNAIKDAVVPGGLVIYETFTREQANLGRPKNPDFLLDSGELQAQFSGWQVLHQFEGIANGSAVANIVAGKPL